MNGWGKILLVATSVTPVFFVCSLNNLAHSDYKKAGIFALIFVLLALLFLYILFFVIGKQLPESPLNTSKVKSADKEVLAFLLTYLLPLFFKDNIKFAGEFISALVVVIVIGFTIYHSTAYTFNPLLAFLGYRFYEVESEGMTYLLISKSVLLRPDNQFTVKHLCDYIYIEVPSTIKGEE